MKKEWVEPEISVLSVKQTELWVNGHSKDGWQGAAVLSDGSSIINVVTDGFSGGTGGLAETQHKNTVNDYLKHGWTQIG